MDERYFARRMEALSAEELTKIINQKDGYVPAAVSAARRELAARNTSRDEFNNRPTQSGHRVAKAFVRAPKQTAAWISTGTTLLIVAMACSLGFTLIISTFTYQTIKQFIFPRFHQYSDSSIGPDYRIYQSNEVAFPGELANIGVEISALLGDVLVTHVDVFSPSYVIREVQYRRNESLQRDYGKGVDTLSYPPGTPLVNVPVTTRIAFRLPPNDQLYGGILPVHYTVFAKIPILMTDNRHFFWKDAEFSGEIPIKIATRSEALQLEIYFWSYVGGAILIWLSVGTVLWTALMNSELNPARTKTKTL